MSISCCKSKRERNFFFHVCFSFYGSCQGSMQKMEVNSLIEMDGKVKRKHARDVNHLHKP
jgi:hypothetical protein